MLSGGCLLLAGGLYAECAAQSEDPVLKALRKTREELKKLDSDVKGAVETFEKVLRGIKSNIDLIKPLMARLLETAKIDQSQDLQTLFQKLSVDFSTRIASLGTLRELIEDPPGPWLDVKSRPDFAEDDRACRIALAAYGTAALGPDGPIPIQNVPLDPRLDHYRYCVQEYSGIPMKDIIFVSSDKSSVYHAEAKPEFDLCPVFFIAVDHRSKSIILSIRGTLSLADMMTDCIADTAPFAAAGRGAVGHNGIVQAAELVRERGAAALEAAAVATGYSTLRLTGHSLGGATAHALAISLTAEPLRQSSPGKLPANLPPSITRIDSIAFGPPPFLSALKLPFMAPGLPPPVLIFASIRRPTLQLKSFVHDLDIVPRTSLYGLELFASFLAGEEKSTTHDPDLFLPSEVVIVREEEGRMQYKIVDGSVRYAHTRF